MRTKSLGKIFFIWAVLFGLATFGFNKVLDYQRNPNRNPETRQTDKRTAEVRLLQNRMGHYVANGTINGQEVTFLLDTGATTISIPARVARRLGLKKGYPQRVNTANGSVTVFTTQLQIVTLGTIQLHDLRGDINPHMGGEEILLGMSFMKHLEIIQRNRQLLLRQQI